ncbi:hypothetical protein BD311DRAFT_759596 [Dichomitus squalens]|uniref:Uncharacterized protein n=1 Tax=Dichomitus squalens TaxID=114155 RepID=A0A4V2K087_9APHY|nr:hypothetical protein BD311DRAFT_759596 [Dichomitus squalens]
MARVTCRGWHRRHCTPLGLAWPIQTATRFATVSHWSCSGGIRIRTETSRPDEAAFGS